jgi:hypothetical protein
VVLTGGIKVLFVVRVSVIVIFRELNMEIWDPAKFAVDISIFGKFRIVRHPSSFNFVLFIGVKLAFGHQGDDFLVAEGLVEVLLKYYSLIDLLCSTYDFAN